MKKWISYVLSALLLLGLLPLGALAAAPSSAQPPVSSAQAGPAEPAEPGSVILEDGEEDPLQGSAQVLLIYDHMPWDSTANETVLEQLGLSYHRISTAQLGQVNLWDYKLAIIGNDQGSASYEGVKEFRDALDLFINLGGVVIFGAADGGWADGYFDWELPGGVVKHLEYDNYNYIAAGAEDHPIVTGVLTDGTALTDDDLYSTYCSHDYFDEDTLPRNATVIFRSSLNDAPTLAEYPLGSGHVIASSLTWEYSYTELPGYFSTKAMDDLFAYAWSLTQELDEPQAANKMQIGRDNNSFSHTDASFFRGYYNDDQVFVPTEDACYVMDPDLLIRLYRYYLSDTLDYELDSVNPLLLLQKVLSTWKGSCFGLSATMALVFQDEIDLSLFDADAADYYHMDSPRDNQRVRSMINYYQLAQYVPLVSKRSTDAYRSDPDAFQRALETIVKLAMQSEVTGVPFVFTMGYKWVESVEPTWVQWGSGGHAIVCIGASETESGHVLEFIDPNNTGARLYATVPDDFSGIFFSNTYNAQDQLNNRGRQNWQITRVGYTTLSALQTVDIDSPEKEQEDDAYTWGKCGETASLQSARYDVINFHADGAFTLTAEDGAVLSFDGAELGGDMEVYSYRCLEQEDSLDITVSVDAHSVYTLVSQRGALEISISNDDNYAGFSGTGAETLVVNVPENSVTAQGEDMNYKLYLGVMGDSPELMQLSGQGAGQVSLAEDDGEITLNGDALEDVTLTGHSVDKEYDLTDTLQVNGEGEMQVDTMDRGRINFNAMIGKNETSFITFYDANGRLLRIQSAGQGSAVVQVPEDLNWSRAVLYRLNADGTPRTESVVREAVK
ncbi:MAG: hypothetical protein K5990_00230 [Oscillospiraceae bacterium]|nr:hypothetical protein [Oscillospiraceae bacterium]